LSDEKERAVAWNRLGNVHRKLNEYTLAVQAFQKADELDGENAGFRDDLDEAPRVSESGRPGGANEMAGAAAVETLDPLQLIVAEGRAQEFAAAATQQAEMSAADEADPVAAGEGAAPGLETMVDEPANASTEVAASDDVSDVATETEGLPQGEALPVAAANITEPMSAEPPFEPIAAEPTAGAAEMESPVEPSENQVEPPVAIPAAAEGELVSLPVESASEPELLALASDLPASESPAALPHQAFPGHVAYDEYLKDNDPPLNIMINEAGEQVVPDQEPGQEPPAAKIDESGELQIEMDAKNAHVWNELGNIYFNNGEFDDAVIAYSKSIELDRWFAWPYSNLALTYVQKNRFAEAILLYQRSIELFKDEKDQAITWNRLGNVYRRLNDYDNAIAAYQHADDLDPDNATLSLQSRFSLLGSYAVEPKPAYVS
jgi:tetratricopeptide (TPR) repeat protein